MNIIFFLIPILIGISFVPFSYAQIQLNEEPLAKIDGVNYLKFTDTGSVLQVETMFASVTLDKNTCAFNLYNGGYISGNPLFSDSIKPFNKLVNSTTWNEVTQISTATCEASWNGSTLTAKQYKAGVGLLEYKYIWTGKEWKTQLEATNLTALTNRVFGFNQIINLNRDTITWGGQQKNIDNFHNQTFDRNWLKANHGKLVKLTDRYNFDVDVAFSHLESVSVYDTGENKSQLVFHYFNSNEILMPGQTLILDPAITQDGSVVTDSGTTATSDSTSITVGSNNDRVLIISTMQYNAAADTVAVTVGGNPATLAESSDTGGGNNVKLWYYIAPPVGSNTVAISMTTGSAYSYAIYSLYNVDQVDPIGVTADLAGSSPTQPNGAITPTTTGSWIMDGLRSISTASPTESLTNGFETAPVANVYHNGQYDATPTISASNSMSWSNLAGGFNWNWVGIEVKPSEGLSPPNPITSMTYANLGANSVDIIWTPPNSFGGGTFQTYTLNSTTPWGAPLTFVGNTTSLFFNVTGLTFGTDYSFRASAVTEIAYNTTGAYILNITTTSTSYSLPPTSLVATSDSATQIDLQWVASAMQNILGYKIERETPINTGWATIVANTTNTNIYYNNTGLSTNIIYNYRVSAINGSGISTPSNTYAMTTFHLPDAVTDLTGTATDLSTIDLSWTAPESYAPEITGYMINGTTPTGEPVDILNANTGSDATTATAFNILIGQEYSFRVSPITVHGKNASGNIWNGSTIQTFVIGDLSNPDITNDDDFSIFFDRTDVNASAVQLDVTYPNSYDLSCDFSYKYARTNQTYSSLTTVPEGTDDQVATFVLVNATGDLIQVRCWDVLTGDESTYVITITDFPFLQQVNALRSGEYGTFFQIGAFDGVMLIVIFLGMIGLNRTTPIVGIVFVVVTVFTMQYFGLITYPIIMYPAMIMMIVWAFVSTRKDD